MGLVPRQLENIAFLVQKWEYGLYPGNTVDVMCGTYHYKRGTSSFKAGGGGVTPRYNALGRT